ncbi:MAG: HAD-IA family hydrolase [Pseudomonadota bacterium]
MIKAVFWDFGGVITTSPFESFNRFESSNGMPKDFIRSINATNPDTNAWAQFESSQVTLDEFDDLFAQETAAAGHEIRGKQVIALLSGDLRPEMIETLHRCKTRYTIACLTNNVKGMNDEDPQRAGDSSKASKSREVMALFDHVIESSVVGIRKPNPKFYQMACEMASVKPEEVVYLDDLGINLKPARQMGMTTIKVIDPIVALKELEQAVDLKLLD